MSARKRRRHVRRRLPRLGKMLVSLDGSEAAERVIPYVERLAAATNASFVLLEAVPTAASFASIGASPASGVVHFVAAAERIHDEADDYLATTAETLAAEGVRTTHAVADGSPAKEILRAAEQEGPDLIENDYAGARRARAVNSRKRRRPGPAESLASAIPPARARVRRSQK